MRLVFTVRDPLSINGFYVTNPKTRRRFISREGKAFKARIVAAATIARALGDWPADPLRIVKARLSYQLYDYKGDSDGPRKCLRDSLERLLYANDRIVEDGPAPLPVRDGGGRRVVVTVEALELRTAQQADIERSKQRQRIAQNAQRRAKRRNAA